jgi:hypothetical protein
MATVMRVQGGFANIRFEIDYDDVLLRLLAVRCVNDSDHTCRASLTQIANGRTYTRDFAPHTTQSLSIPTNVAGRINVTIDARGRVDGVDWSFQESV